MTRKLTGPPLVAYLRQFPSSDDRGWAADEIERLRDAVEALLANPSGMYCDGYPEAERKARAALAQGEV